MSKEIKDFRPTMPYKGQITHVSELRVNTCIELVYPNDVDAVTGQPTVDTAQVLALGQDAPTSYTGEQVPVPYDHAVLDVEGLGVTVVRLALFNVPPQLPDAYGGFAPAAYLRHAPEEA